MVKQWFSLGLALWLFASVHACTKVQRSSIELLRKTFGIEPFYPNGELNATGYVDDFVATAGDWNCNFNVDSTALSAANATNGTTASLCKWKNMKSERADLDSDTFYMFRKTANQPWTVMNPKRTAAKQTPPVGDGFVLAGNQKAPPTDAVIYSEPAKCSKNDLSLTFDYWLYSLAKVRVYQLEQKTWKTLFASNETSCTSTKPSDGRCKVTIPATDKPFHLAIQGYNLFNSFVILDNVAVAGDLGQECVGGPQFDPSKVDGKPLDSRSGAAPIQKAEDLNCKGDATCKWTNAPSTATPQDPQFVVVPAGTGPAADKNYWTTTTGETSVPDGDYLYAYGKSGTAKLISDPITCQSADGTLTFKAWLSKGMKLDVCVVDAESLKTSNPSTNKPYPCTTIKPPMTGGQYSVPVAGPLNNVRLAFIGTDWDSGNGGWMVVDDVQYTAPLCTGGGGGSTGPATDPDSAACKALSVHFDLTQDAANAIWAPVSGSAITNVQLVPYTVQPKFELSLVTEVKCPDEGSCAGVALDKSTTQPQASVWESKTFSPLQQSRYIELSTHRGTYGSKMYVCSNTLPVYGNNADVDISASPQCKSILPDGLSYKEYREGLVTGAALPAGTTKVYIAFANPVDSGSATAGFLVDRIRLLRDANPASQQMTC
jgi:hypothetical protein